MKVLKEGNKLILTIDLEPEASAPRSSTGKSKVLFSTHGFVAVEGGEVKLSVNVIK